MKNTLYILTSLLVLIACSTQQKITFNKNWSGKVVTTIDMTMLSQLSGLDEEDTATIFQDSINAFKIESLKKIKGINNVKIESNTATVSVLSYEFDDVSALNASAFLFTQEMLSDPLHNFFKLNGKNEIEISLPKLKSEGEEDLSIGDQFLYEMEVDFAKNIKSFKSDCDTIIQKNNSLLIKTNLSSLMNPKKSHKTTVKVK